jgi:hypothetical protein
MPRFVMGFMPFGHAAFCFRYAAFPYLSWSSPCFC